MWREVESCSCGLVAQPLQSRATLNRFLNCFVMSNKAVLATHVLTLLHALGVNPME